jgi:micrococcal nuclease
MSRSRSRRRTRRAPRINWGIIAIIAAAVMVFVALNPSPQAVADLIEELLGEPQTTSAPAQPSTTARPPVTARPGAETGDGRAVLGDAYPARPSRLDRTEITRVVDGDTVRVRSGSGEETLRLIGLNTPETRDPRRGVECFGREASARAKELLEGQTVFLEADSSQDERDRYGRLLRFVWMEDGRLFNLEMIAEGYAFEYTYERPYKYQAAFREVEAAARGAQLGLWSPQTCNGESKPAE